jgi:hypothetical protein
MRLALAMSDHHVGFACNALVLTPFSIVDEAWISSSLLRSSGASLAYSMSCVRRELPFASLSYLILGCVDHRRASGIAVTALLAAVLARKRLSSPPKYCNSCSRCM